MLLDTKFLSINCMNDLKESSSSSITVNIKPITKFMPWV